MKNSSVGLSDFREVHILNRYYLDKTLFIKEVINCKDKIILITRPHLFGKTLNMTMLKYFFELSPKSAENRKLFNNLNITKEAEFDLFQGKYPVIYISFKDISASKFEDTLDNIKNIAAEIFNSFKYLVESLEPADKQYFENILSKNVNQDDLIESIKKLCGFLHGYHAIAPILLIDEYDTPLEVSYVSNYYLAMSSFLKKFFNATLKNNTNIFKTVVTGILVVDKKVIFRGINNMGIFTILSSMFADKFGFVKSEVEQLAKDRKIPPEYTEIERCYKGYIFGKTVIYNPFSILQYVTSYYDNFKVYWANAVSYDIVKKMIINSSSDIKNELRLLLQNQKITKRLNENIVFLDLEKDENNIYNYLFFSGYLNALNKCKTEEYVTYDLIIPNVEIQTFYKNLIRTWFSDAYSTDVITDMFTYLVLGDRMGIEYIFNDFILTTLSYFDSADRNVEKIYQAFLLAAIINLNDTHDVNVEQDLKEGRYDVVLMPCNKSKLALVLGIKRKNVDESKTKALNSAVRHIKSRKYADDLLHRGYEKILELGLIFDGKYCWTKKG